MKKNLQHNDCHMLATADYPNVRKSPHMFRNFIKLSPSFHSPFKTTTSQSKKLHRSDLVTSGSNLSANADKLLADLLRYLESQSVAKRGCLCSSSMGMGASYLGAPQMEPSESSDQHPGPLLAGGFNPPEKCESIGIIPKRAENSLGKLFAKLPGKTLGGPMTPNHGPLDDDNHHWSPAL